MSYRWLIGIPLLVSVLLWGVHRWGSLPTPSTVSRVIDTLSPWPTTQPSPASSPTLVTPCNLVTGEELNALTSSTYLPPRLSSDDSQANLLVQRCLWLASDEKLTPTVTVSLVTSEPASPSASSEYWSQYIAENQSNNRFKVIDVADALSSFTDSWGTHVQTTTGIVTVQVSMPDPKQNQLTELRVLEVILPRLLAADS